jgi:ABC-2 type transport system ATP-binding protein
MVESKSVTKFYGHIKAVEDINFTLNAGEIVGFVGPNGAGKSTVLKMLSTFIYPTAGTIRIDGLDVIKHSLEIRRRIGYLSGDTPLYQGMRVDRFLRFVAQARGLSGTSLKRQFTWVVGLAGLEDVLTKRINQCSTGFRQRIGLATALIHDPAILLLDEPTHGFDPIQVLAFRDTLKELSPNRVILFSTHIISEVAALSDRVMVINEGALLADGTLAELSRSAAIAEQDLEGIFAHLIRNADKGENSIA